MDQIALLLALGWRLLVRCNRKSRCYQARTTNRTVCRWVEAQLFQVLLPAQRLHFRFWILSQLFPALLAQRLLMRMVQPVVAYPLVTLLRNMPENAAHKLKNSLKPSSRSDPQPPIETSLAALGPVGLSPLTQPADRSLCNEYIQRYHYLGYKQPFGYRQRYFLQAGANRLGCILLSGPAKALTARDRWIGWDDRQRLKNLPWVVNNSRFLIFPWVKVTNLASHVLGQLARRVGDDWQRRWGYRPLLLETFVDPAHFQGSCYRAAGWELLGRTTGEGLVRPGRRYQTSPKLIFAKPLQADFRCLLCSDQLSGRTER